MERREFGHQTSYDRRLAREAPNLADEPLEPNNESLNLADESLGLDNGC